jgi:hypothetical protein
VKLGSYLLPGEMQVRLGAAIDLKGKTHLIGLPEMLACMGGQSGAAVLPNEMLRLLEQGDAGLGTARSVVNHAAAQLAAPATVSQWMALLKVGDRINIAIHPLAGCQIRSLPKASKTIYR